MILSYIQIFFEVVSTLLITPFMIRTLGQAEYGVYKLSTSITSYLLLLDMGVGNAIIRYIAKFRANKDSKAERDFFGVAIVFYSIIAFISLLGGFFLLKTFSSMFGTGMNSAEIALGKKLLLITVVNAAITLCTAVYANVIIAYGHFSTSRGSLIVQIILRMILTVVMLKLGLGSFGMVLVNLVLTILCRVFFVLYVFKVIGLRPNFNGISYSFVKEISIYSSLVLAQAVATQINASIDHILLGVMVPEAASIIAVYSIGTQVVQYFKSIGSSFNGILMPGVVNLVEKHVSAQQICEEMVRIGRFMFMILCLIWSGFVVFGQQFINLWVGSSNKDAYHVALILMSAYLFIMTESIGSQILWAKNEHKEQAILKLFVVFLNIVLTAILIRWKPLLGATIGTFVSLLVGDILVMNIIFSKKLQICLRQYYQGLLEGLLPCIIFTIGFGFVVNLFPIAGWVGLLLKILIMCFMYAAMMWFWGLNNYEKKVLKSLLRKGN